MEINIITKTKIDSNCIPFVRSYFMYLTLKHVFTMYPFLHYVYDLRRFKVNYPTFK